VNYFLVALLEHVATTKVQFESGKVRENWVRKPYGWDGVELGARVLIKDSRTETLMASPVGRPSNTS
jgi:hypothetical protein